MVEAPLPSPVLSLSLLLGWLNGLKYIIRGTGSAGRQEEESESETCVYLMLSFPMMADHSELDPYYSFCKYWVIKCK